MSRVRIGKDVVSHIASRLEGRQEAWRERALKQKAYPYLYLDAPYLEVDWGESAKSMALSAGTGVNGYGYRKVLAVEAIVSEKSAAYVSLLRGLLDRGLRGVRLSISDDYEGVRAAVAGALPGVESQRCIVHFMRNVLTHVSAKAVSEVAEDFKAIFEVRREKASRALAEEFVELYRKRFSKVASIFEAGIGISLTCLRYPESHHARHARIRSTNMLEHLLKEVKRRTRVVGVFPNETSMQTLATDNAMRSNEERELKRYLTVDALEAVEKPNPQYSSRWHHDMQGDSSPICLPLSTGGGELCRLPLVDSDVKLNPVQTSF